MPLCLFLLVLQRAGPTQACEIGNKIVSAAIAKEEIE